MSDSLYANHHDGPTATPQYGHGPGEDPDGPSDEGMSLIGQLVGANVENLKFATDAVEAGLRREIADLAKTIVEIDKIISLATVIDRQTEARLRFLDPRISAAYDTLERSES